MNEINFAEWRHLVMVEEFLMNIVKFSFGIFIIRLQITKEMPQPNWISKHNIVIVGRISRMEFIQLIR